MDGSPTSASPFEMPADQKRRFRVSRLLGTALVTLSASCGSPTTGQDPSVRPTEDTALEASRSPAIVAIVGHRTPDSDLLGGFRCTGVLVAPTTVLTAKHCVGGLEPGNVDVVVNVANLCLSTSPDDRHAVRRIRSERFLDLAELQLSASSDLAPARLANRAPDPGTALLAVGWGNMRGNGDPCQRTVAHLAPTPEDACAEAVLRLPSQARAAQICALPTTGRNTCQGDSGGPLFDISGPQPALVAVTSSGIGGCEPTDIGLYTNVTAEADHSSDGSHLAYSSEPSLH